MSTFCNWLAHTSLSLFIGSLSWIIPAVQSIHIFTIAVLFFSVLFLDARLIGLGDRDHSIVEVEAQYLPWVWRALPVLLLSGAILIIGEPERSLLNPAFWVKMLCLVGAIVTTLLLRATIKRRPTLWQRPSIGRAMARGVATLSFLLWVGVVVGGRAIAYFNAGDD